jgi:hypothetical protein
MQLMHSKRWPTLDMSPGCMYQQRLTPIPTLSLTGRQPPLPPRSRKTEGRPPTRELPRLTSSDALFRTVDSRRLPLRGGCDLATLVISNANRQLTTVTFDPPVATVRKAPRLAPLNRVDPPVHTDQTIQPLQSSRAAETMPSTLFRRNSSPLAPFYSDSACTSPIGACRFKGSMAPSEVATRVDNLLLSGASLTCPPVHSNVLIEDGQRIRGSPTHAFYKNSKIADGPAVSIFNASPSLVRRDDDAMTEIDEVLNWSDRAASQALTL